MTKETKQVLRQLRDSLKTDRKYAKASARRNNQDARENLKAGWIDSAVEEIRAAAMYEQEAYTLDCVIDQINSLLNPQSPRPYPKGAHHLSR